MAPRDEDQAAEPLAEGRAVTQFRETHQTGMAWPFASRLQAR
jgi:hypothetical protein